MVTTGKKRKSTTNVNEPQKKSPKINKGKEKPTPPPANKKTISPVSSNKANGKLQKKGATPKVVASKVKAPATRQKASPTPKTDQGKGTPKAEKKGLKKTSPKIVPKVKKEQGQSVEQTFSKSLKTRLLKKKRMGNLKEKAVQGDQETLTKIKGVIKRIEESGQSSKHSQRKLVQYKNLLALYSKGDKSTPKKTKKALKKSA